MRHLECTDILSVILDPIQRVSEGGIVVDEDSAILENEAALRPGARGS